MDKIQKGYLILIFLISPFLGIVKVFKIKDEKTITFFGTLLFGLVGSTFVYIKGTDGHSHLMKAIVFYTDMSLGDFFTKTYEIITFNSTKGSTDLYLHIISYLSASVLQNPSLIHVFAGLVLGYFFTKSVLLVMRDNLETKKGYILIGFIVLFLLVKSIGALNSIRMWTGMWVLFYGTYSYAINKEKKYLYIILFSVLVHFSYVLILIPVVISYVAQKRKIIVTFVYALSFFTTLGFSVFQAYIPESDLLEKKQKYTVIDSNEKAKLFEKTAQNAKAANANLNFYKGSGEINYLNYSIVGLTILLLFFYLRRETDAKLNFLIAIGVGLYTFANLVSFSPALQGRSKTIAATFILAAAIHLQFTMNKYLLSQKTKRIFNTGFVLFLISVIPMFLFQISDIMYNISFFILLFPQVSWFLGDGDYSIRGVIGLLID
ncbi:MAG: hypothetical protein K2Y30_15910 [Flavobacteriaceae bacterium]|nr:hypothetical protein [Flavobacteriaceae bacterium]